MLSKEQMLAKIQENIEYFETWEEANENLEAPDRFAMKLSIGVTLHFADGHTPKIRQLMPKIVKAYYDRLGKNITGGYMTNKEDQTLSGKKLQGKLLEKCLDPKTWQDVDEQMSLGWDSIDLEGTTGNRFDIFLADAYTSWDGLSWIHIAIPYNKVDELKTFQELIVEICNLIALHSGYGGFWASLPDQFYSYEEHQTPIAYRFYGCEIDNNISYGIESPPSASKASTGSQSWGNRSSKKWGENVLTQKAQDLGLGVESVGQNIIIQAGEYPDICDNEDLPMNPYYVAVNHLLKPIRKETIGSLHMGSMTGASVLNTAASDEWLRRFDQYPMPDMTLYKPVDNTQNEPKTATPPSRYTAETVAVGDVCKSTGMYQAPFLDGKVVMLSEGQKVLGDEHNHLGRVFGID